MYDVSGFRRSNFCSNHLIETLMGAPYRFHGLMYLRCFKGILRNITYMDSNPPVYKDSFQKFHQLIDKWNKIIVEIFNSSWESYLQDSMRSGSLDEIFLDGYSSKGNIIFLGASIIQLLVEKVPYYMPCKLLRLIIIPKNFMMIQIM